MSYHHLTISERIRIEVLSILGYSTRFIAKFLHRHHSTIARELSRNKIKMNMSLYLLTITILNVVKILLTLVNIMMFFLILFPKNYMKIGLQNRFLMHF